MFRHDVSIHCGSVFVEQFACLLAIGLSLQLGSPVDIFHSHVYPLLYSLLVRVQVLVLLGQTQLLALKVGLQISLTDITIVAAV
jgi:hypothetical protein